MVLGSLPKNQTNYGYYIKYQTQKSGFIRITDFNFVWFSQPLEIQMFQSEISMVH